MTTKEKVIQTREIIGELFDIKKRPMKYALSDLNDWLEKNLDKVSYLLDEIQDDLTPDYPDQQMIENAELDLAIERMAV